MIWAIIPAKPLVRAKSRLAGVLSPSQRRALCLEMLGRVVKAVQATPGLRWLVISRERRALRLAREGGGWALLDRSQDLNASLAQAARWCADRGASALLVLPSDLPLIQGQDISAMLELAQEEGCLVVSPCSRQEGTNALLIRPPGALDFTFGPGSFQAHLRQAQQRGLAVHVFLSPRLALDIDTPEDLAAFLAAEESLAPGSAPWQR
jgi:2-phospho-L-lactate guanylyltransferase